MARWINWQKKSTLGQWRWLKGLGIYPRRRPVMDSTEELGDTKEEEEEDIQERSEGEEGRDLSIADTTRGPRLTLEEKTRLLNCEMPCTREE